MEKTVLTWVPSNRKKINLVLVSMFATMLEYESIFLAQSDKYFQPSKGDMSASPKSYSPPYPIKYSILYEFTGFVCQKTWSFRFGRLCVFVGTFKMCGTDVKFAGPSAQGGFGMQVFRILFSSLFLLPFILIAVGS